MYIIFLFLCKALNFFFNTYLREMDNKNSNIKDTQDSTISNNSSISENNSNIEFKNSNIKNNLISEFSKMDISTKMDSNDINSSNNGK